MADVKAIAKAIDPIPDNVVEFVNTVTTEVEADARAIADTAIQEWASVRQAAEDARANHRNLNRMLTLIGALVIGVCVSYVLSHPGLVLTAHACKVWSPYAFCITILMDSSLAAYSFVRKY